MRNSLLILLIAAAIMPALAQAPTATLSGKVLDQTGAVIPQATVTVTAPGASKAQPRPIKAEGSKFPRLSRELTALPPPPRGSRRFRSRAWNWLPDKNKL